MLLVSVSLTACSKAAVPTPPAPDPVPPVPISDAPAPDPDPKGKNITEQPQPPAPAPATPSATAPTPPAPAGGSQASPPTQVAPKPAIKWYPRGIGLPLTSDDPAAKAKKVALLTFDDGPSDTGSTVSILETLARENVKAMFFITGYGAKHRDLVERIHREGHVLGPHTQTHANLAQLSVAGIKEELGPVVKVIEEVTGQKPKWLRPPFGAYNESVIKVAKQEYGMDILNWTDGSLDWEVNQEGYKDPKVVVKDTMEQLYPGAVVLMHDTLRHTAEALPEIIHLMKAEGYEFVVLD
ncbi:MAG TPA: polysaccharide deacetylase family protein [Symbiobacteriaceae bacterium]|nr:polysaccharide deacetylase family protein [Symbiobacteriaceae bacterium]